MPATAFSARQAACRRAMALQCSGSCSRSADGNFCSDLFVQLTHQRRLHMHCCHSHAQSFGTTRGKQTCCYSLLIYLGACAALQGAFFVPGGMDASRPASLPFAAYRAAAPAQQQVSTEHHEQNVLTWAAACPVACLLSMRMKSSSSIWRMRAPQMVGFYGLRAETTLN